MYLYTYNYLQIYKPMLLDFHHIFHIISYIAEIHNIIINRCQIKFNVNCIVAAQLNYNMIIMV